MLSIPCSTSLRRDVFMWIRIVLCCFLFFWTKDECSCFFHFKSIHFDIVASRIHFHHIFTVFKIKYSRGFFFFKKNFSIGPINQLVSFFSSSILNSLAFFQWKLYKLWLNYFLWCRMQIVYAPSNWKIYQADFFSRNLFQRRLLFFKRKHFSIKCGLHFYFGLYLDPAEIYEFV